MPDIATISPLSSWSIREFGSAAQFRARISSKLAAYAENDDVLNGYLGNLLQGASGGTEQAKIPFVRSSAPTGWTRDTSFLTDHILRVTDGSTVPPGSSPTAAGGSHGGSWAISGLSGSVVSDHTHTMNHAHTMSDHTHVAASHNHPMDHTHTDSGHSHYMGQNFSSDFSYNDGTLITTNQYWTVGTVYIVANHRHAWQLHNHGSTSTVATGTTSGSSSTETGTSSETSGGASTTAVGSMTGSTGSGGGHTHTVSHDGNWRPSYLNVIMCKKD